MKNGDIDNTPVPRVYVVFEGTIVQPKKELKQGVLRRLRGERLNDYELDTEVSRSMWDIWQRLNVRFDAMTFAFDADDVYHWCDDHHVPISSAWRFDSREDFVQQMPFMPWVAQVVDHAAPMAYGVRGTSLAGLWR